MNCTPLMVRKATIHDLPAIMIIEEESFDMQTRETQPVFQKRMEIFPQGFLVLENNANVSGYFCSELWNSLPAADYSGFADMFSLGHDAVKAHNIEGTVLYISSFALLPEYRGNGMGRSFFRQSLASILAAAPQIREQVLLVNEQWTAARHIYESLGFKQCAMIPGFFHDGDGIVMLRPAR